LTPKRLRHYFRQIAAAYGTEASADDISTAALAEERAGRLLVTALTDPIIEPAMIAQLVELTGLLAERLELIVARLVADGWSWTDIAIELGVTPQQAWSQFAGLAARPSKGDTNTSRLSHPAAVAVDHPARLLEIAPEPGDTSPRAEPSGGLRPLPLPGGARPARSDIASTARRTRIPRGAAQ
jgi:hypothetical protein